MSDFQSEPKNSIDELSRDLPNFPLDEGFDKLLEEANEKILDAMNIPLNILVTTAGGPEKFELCVGIQHRMSLPGYDIKVFAMDMNNSVSTESYKEYDIEFLQICASEDPAFIPELQHICIDKVINYIISIDSLETIKISNWIKEIRKSSLADIYQNMKYIGFSGADNLDEKVHLGKCDYFKLLPLELTGPYSLVNTSKDLSKFISEYAWYTKYIIKPNNSHGSRGLRVIDMDMTWDSYFTSKDPYYITHQEGFNLLKLNKDSDEVLVQPFYEGQNYNVDCYATKNELYIVIHEVLGNRWGQVTESRVLGETDPLYRDIMIIATKIRNLLGLNKNFNFEVSTDITNNSLKLVEVNPRVSAVIPQSMKTNRNLILISLLDFLNIPFVVEPIEEYRLKVIFNTLSS